MDPEQPDLVLPFLDTLGESDDYLGSCELLTTPRPTRAARPAGSAGSAVWNIVGRSVRVCRRGRRNRGPKRRGTWRTAAGSFQVVPAAFISGQVSTGNINANAVYLLLGIWSSCFLQRHAMLTCDDVVPLDPLDPSACCRHLHFRGIHFGLGHHSLRVVQGMIRIVLLCIDRLLYIQVVCFGVCQTTRIPAEKIKCG